MKRYLVLLPALALALGLGGCITMNMETTLEGDGSGTFFMSYGMSPSVAEAMQELAELGPGAGEMPTISNIDRAKLEADCKKHGVKLKQFEDKEVDGTLQAVVELEFPNLDSFNAVMGGAMSDAGGGGGMQLRKTADGNFVLQAVEAKDMESDDMEDDEEPEEAPTSPEDFNPEDLQKSMEIMGKLMGSISELDVSMRISVPGDIVESSAMRTEGRTAIWEINGQNVMTMGNEMDEPKVVFSGKGLKLDAPMLEN